MKSINRIYIDSSVVLSFLLRENDLQMWNNFKGEIVTSELTEAECCRTLDRIRLNEKVTDEEIAERLSELELILSSLRIIQINTVILKRAKGSFPTVVRSLDAIHLATAELSKCSQFVTLDKQQGTAAKALGLDY